MSIKKFEKDMLKGKPLRIQKKHGDLSYPIHRHDYFEIIYYSGSSGKCLLNGTEYPICENSVFFLTPEDFHLIETENIKTAYSVNLSFSKSIIDSRIGDSFTLSAKAFLNCNEFINEMIKRIETLYDEKSELSTNEIYHLLNALLIEIIKNGVTAGKKAPYMHPVIGKAMMYVLGYPDQNFTLTDIAKVCHISPAYFSHIFHTQTGKPFKKWLNEVKIEHACRLLENSELSILEISLESGFHSISHFGKTFKNLIGMTPKEYRAFGILRSE